ncbi:hypothetical protein ACJJTC_000832, partial [Scirpophaga incertulas]
MDSTDWHNKGFVVITTVQQLKEKVREQLGIEPNLQRLIFCGRVLQDDSRLSQLDVNGKVVHLVQRAPPGPDSRNPRTGAGLGSSSGSGGGGGGSSGGQANGRGRGRFLNNTTVLSPTAGRLDALRRLINEIKACMNYLRAQMGESSADPATSSAAPVDTLDSENTPDAPIDEEANNHDDGEGDNDGEGSSDNPVRSQTQRRNNRGGRTLRARLNQPRQLAQLIEEIDNLQDEFAPHRADFVRILRSANEPEDYSEEQRRQSQILADLVSDMMHSFSHAYHIISDISLVIGQRNVRLNSDPAVTRHLIPMQAQVNVFQARRMNQQNPSATATAPSEDANTEDQTTAQLSNATTNTTSTATAFTAPPVAAPTAASTATSTPGPTAAPAAGVAASSTGASDSNNGGTHHASLA